MFLNDFEKKSFPQIFRFRVLVTTYYSTLPIFEMINVKCCFFICGYKINFIESPFTFQKKKRVISLNLLNLDSGRIYIECSYILITFYIRHHHLFIFLILIYNQTGQCCPNI